jgi:electron transfer flavoprotein alpha subunit
LAEITVGVEECTGCGLCVEACPYQCITLVEDVAAIGEGCTLCGACVDVCPSGAIQIVRERKETDLTAYGGVLVFGEQVGGTLSPVVYELLGKGRELADKMGEDLECAVLGAGMDGAAEDLISCRVDTVHLVESPLLATFRDDPYTQVLGDLAEDTKPSVVLLGATNIGRSLAPRLAVRLKTGLTADCTSLDVDENGNLLQTRPAFGGNVMATILRFLEILQTS